MSRKGLLLGFGTMGTVHWERYRQLGVDIAVVEVEPQAQHTVREHNVDVYPSLEAAWKRDRYAFIDICTPTNLHFQHIEEALRYHVPLLVEKPVVRTSEEATLLPAKVGTLPVMVGEVEQYNPNLTGFSGSSAEPVNVSMERLVNLEFFLHGTAPWFLDEQHSGGIVLDLMIHDLTLLIAKYGIPAIEKVQGTASGRYGIRDDVTATLRYPAFSVHLHGSWVSNDVQPIRSRITLEAKQGNSEVWDGGQYGIDRPLEGDEDPFLQELKTFLATVETGITPYPLELFCEAVVLANVITDRLKAESVHG